MRSRLGRVLATVGLLSMSVVGALGVAEAVLRVVLPTPDSYYIFSPGLDREFEPREDLMPGVSGRSRFRVNSLGLRGDEPGPSDRYRILAVGGSTTQCLYLDQSEAWPQGLQELLGERLSGVWVGNAGKAGRRLPEYRVQLEELLGQLPDLDAVILLVGANDVNRRLNEGDAFEPIDVSDPEVRESLVPRAFDVHPRDYALVPIRRTALWGLLDRVRRAIQTRQHWQMIQDRAGANYQLWRERRSEASGVREELPDLSSGLEAYRRDLEAVLALTRRHGVRVIFVTQPSIYREDLPAELERLLWMGWVGERQTDRDQEYYSISALAEAYAAYNRALLAFCSESHAECIDLDATVPKDATSFYDDIHFNESGSESVAGRIYEHLLEHPPFAN